MSKVFNMVGGGGGPAASIFVTGLSETDTVTATKGSKMVHGKWVTKTKTVTNSPLIPAMTSNTEPSGVASATKVYSDNLAYRAFDGDDSTYAYGSVNALPWTLQYEFPQSVSINSFSYRISTSSGTDGERTATHNVQVSLDGSAWETIWSGQTSRGGNNPESGTITLAETKTIKYIRWVNTAVTGSANPSEQVFSLQVYGEGEVIVSGFEISNIRDMGTWTVTATNGEKTATQDVLVDAITEYDIEMGYKLWLYKDGDECEDVTGGWIGASGSQSSFTLAKNSDSIEGKNSYCETGDIARFGTTNTINLTYYSKMFIRHDYGGTASKFRVGYKIGTTALKPTTNLLQTDNLPNSSSSNTNVLTEIDLSYDGDYCFVVTLDSGNVGETVYDKIYEIWLE